ncbi:hypothetical protein CSC18_2263 [Klebsiella aerogenes]|nr:hypothetical protein CSC18_2263 [Klebsiella aerogenes]
MHQPEFVAGIFGFGSAIYGVVAAIAGDSALLVIRFTTSAAGSSKPVMS